MANYAFRVPGGPDTRPELSFTTYTKPYEGKPLSDAIAKDPLRGDPRPFNEGIIFSNKAKTEVYVDNPVLTDVTQLPQTDLKTILSANPDVSGLSLLLEDPSEQNLRDTVSIEDFIEPSNYVDVFDLYNFVNQAEKSFAMLPASLRKAFNNSPLELSKALSSKDNTAAISLLEKYLEPLTPSSDSSGTPSVDRDDQSTTPSTTPSKSTDSSPSKDVS